MEEAWASYKALATPPARHKQLFHKPTEKTTQEKLSDLLKHKKEQDAEVSSPKRLFRGFRRENSDVFPRSTRHSAIYFPKNESHAGAKQQRSSGIFNNPRKQIMKAPAPGEPILTDFIKMNDSLKMSSQGEVKKAGRRLSDKKATGNNPNEALKSVAALIKQESERSSSSRQSSVLSESPSGSVCLSQSASFEKASTPDLTADTLESKARPEHIPQLDIMMRPRREKTESDIVFRRNSHYNRHIEHVASEQEAVLAQLQVTAYRTGWLH